MQRLNSYQQSEEVIPLQMNDVDEAASAALRQSQRFWILKSLLWPLLAATLLTSFVLFDLPSFANLSSLLPTPEERELAKENDLPFWSAYRIRSAQRTANMHGITSWTPKHHSRFVDEVRKKYGAQDYMDVPDGCEATVMILRHCEKGDIREHCDYIGYERSVYLATLFGDDGERWPRPSYIFAMSPTSRHSKKKMNFREIETIGPLANKADVTVDDSYNSHTMNDLAKEILTFLETGQMCGKLTIISWKHSEIAHLARHLGCGPKQGCPLDYRGKTFDSVWQIKFVHRTFEHSNRKDLSLSHKPEWRVFGNEQPEGFDPLHVSKMFGDYPPGGTRFGARWQKNDESVPERPSPKSGDWKATKVGFDETD